MSKIEILIVEDEAIVALQIKRTILKMGFEVINMVSNHDDTIRSIKEKIPDIILLDIHLQNHKDGIETANSIKKIADIPIIYLTAFSDDQTIERAVQTNPLGYLVKPFRLADLKSTLQLAIHKINTKECIESNLVPVGKGYFYDLSNHNLFFKQSPIKLSCNEMLFLELLIEAKGILVPNSVLEYHIWEGQPVSSSALRTLLYRLRVKLKYELIETVSSFGFKLKKISKV